MRRQYNHSHISTSSIDFGSESRNTVEKMIQFDDHFRSVLKLSALRPEARLLMAVLHRGPISIKDAMSDSELSYRAFYTMIDRMKSKALIEVTEDLLDRRVRRIAACQALIVAINDLASSAPI